MECFFPEYIELMPSFHLAYQELMSTEPQVGNIRLVIGRFDQYGIIPFYVVGFDGGCPKGFSLKFSPWEKWLGATVDLSQHSEFELAEIIAIFLLDMMWAGFSSEEVATYRREYIRHQECLLTVYAYVEDIEASESNPIKCKQRSNEFHETLGLHDFDDILVPNDACAEYVQAHQEMEVQAYCLGEAETDYAVYCEKLSALRTNFILQWPTISHSSSPMH